VSRLTSFAFLREENRLLNARLAGRRLRFDDRERRCLAVLGHRLGRQLLAQVATLVTPDTILRWHASWWHTSGRIAPAEAVLRTRRQPSERLSFGWRPRTLRGATRAFRMR
jgi:hypothetical protein